MEKTSQVLSKYRELLDQYVPVVARVHGESHPEFFEVKNEYDNLVSKADSNIQYKEHLDAINKITNGFKIPSDTCETYAAVYAMLEEVYKGAE